MRIEELFESHSTLLKQWIKSGSKHLEDPDDEGSPREDAIEASSRRIKEYGTYDSSLSLLDFDYEIKDVEISKLKHIQNPEDISHESMLIMAKEHLKDEYTKLYRKHDVLPILITSDFTIVDGYHRVASALKNGETTVPTLVPVKPGTGKIINTY